MPHAININENNWNDVSQIAVFSINNCNFILPNTPKSSEEATFLLFNNALKVKHIIISKSFNQTKHLSHVMFYRLFSNSNSADATIENKINLATPRTLPHTTTTKIAQHTSTSCRLCSGQKKSSSW